MIEQTKQAGEVLASILPVFVLVCLVQALCYDIIQKKLPVSGIEKRC